MTIETNGRHFLDVLDAHAEQRGMQDAILFLADGREVSERLSFAGLREQALQLAGDLRRRYPAEARVLLMLPTGLDYARAFIGCLYAGLVAVPLFPPTSRKPRHLNRIAKVIEDAAPAAILCEPAAKGVLQELVAAPGPNIEILGVEELRAVSLVETALPLDGDTLAFLQYTSGSTGSPKGVMVCHRHLLANCRLMQHAYGFTADDRMVNWLPLYHDMGLIGGLLAALYAGMPCYLMASQTFVKAPSVWLEALSRHRGTASFAPNFAYQLCNRTVDEGLIARLDLSHWRHAINGAEPIHPATLREFCRRFAPAGFRPETFSPGYGQAEATLCVSATPAGEPPLLVEVDSSALAAGKVRPAPSSADATVLVGCGYPQPDHEVVVVDPESGRRRNGDEVGELWLRGPSNAAGYWCNEAASVADFQARLADSGEAYLRSGDIGFLHQGQVVICGRLKDLIILNGRNVYPQDVEFAIADAEPAIRAGRLAAFSVANPELGREELVVVGEPQRRYLDPAHHSRLFARMREAVREALDFTSLDRIVLIQPGTIPMTTSGKISRQGARQQWLAGTLSVIGASTGASEPAAEILDAAAVRARIQAGEPPVEAWLAYLQGHILRLAPAAALTPEDSLVASGLDSVTLLALYGTLQSELGWQGGLEILFGEHSLRALAAMLAEAGGTPSPHLPTLSALAPRSEARQSYAQRRLWFLHQLAADDDHHNIVIGLRLEGPLDADALVQALEQMSDRHAILRTAYADRPNGPVQHVLPSSPCVVRRHSLETVSNEAQRECRERLVDGERRTPFRLTEGEVLRAHLLRYQPDAHELILNLHHIAFDGHSTEILLEELSASYAARRLGVQPALPAVQRQYADFAEWEATQLTPARIDQALGFWRTYLESAPQVLRLPQEPGGAVTPEHFHVDRATCAALARLSQGQGQTLFMTLLSLFGVLLHYLSGQDRFLIGTDVAGRTQPEWARLIGFFVNQLPLRCDFSGESTLGEACARVRADAQAAYAHQDLPFDLLVSALAPTRSSRQAPLFQVKLNYQRDRSQALQLDGTSLAEVRVEQNLGGFDLVLDLVHGSRGIAACLTYDPGRFGVLQMQRLGALWTRLLVEAERLLPLPLEALRSQLTAWDEALQREQQRQNAAADRAQLAQIRRRPVHG